MHTGWVGTEEQWPPADPVCGDFSLGRCPTLRDMQGKNRVAIYFQGIQ